MRRWIPSVNLSADRTYLSTRAQQTGQTVLVPSTPVKTLIRVGGDKSGKEVPVAAFLDE